MSIIEKETTQPGTQPFWVDEPATLTRLKQLMARIEYKIAVTGTLPGAGVSTFTLNLGRALRHATQGSHGPGGIGILDLGGSPFPRRLATRSAGLKQTGSSLAPARGVDEIKVVPYDLLMGDQFVQGMPGLREWRQVQGALGEVDWRGLDLLMIELPSDIDTVGDLSEVLPPIDGALIVSSGGQRERERIRSLRNFFDASTTPAVGLFANDQGESQGEDVEILGRTFGIPLRATIPFDSALASGRGHHRPAVLADVAEDLVDYLIWLHDEHEQEEDF